MGFLFVKLESEAKTWGNFRAVEFEDHFWLTDLAQLLLRLLAEKEHGVVDTEANEGNAAALSMNTVPSPGFLADSIEDDKLGRTVLLLATLAEVFA